MANIDDMYCIFANNLHNKIIEKFMLYSKIKKEEH